MMSPRSVAESSVSLKSELGDLDSPASGKPGAGKKLTKTCDKEQITDNIDVKESATATSKCCSSNLYCCVCCTWM